MDIRLNPPLASCKLNVPGFGLAAALVPYGKKFVGGLDMLDNTGELFNETEGDTALRFKPIDVGYGSNRSSEAIFLC